MAEIAVPRSKRKTQWLILLSAGLVAGGAFVWSLAEPEQSPLLLKSVAALCILFFGSCGGIAFTDLFNHRPGLILDAEGIVLNPGRNPETRVDWEDITGLSVAEIHRQKFIVIEVANPQKFIAQGSFLSQKLKAANYRLVGSPFAVSAVVLVIDFHQLLHLLTEAWRHHQTDHEI